MANASDKLELQNLIIEIDQLPIGICFPKQVYTQDRNQKKVAKEPNSTKGGYL
jgi:hypothetical protein